ncbi:MAG: fibronectin type III domain-containing protein, partial [Longimicrobiales bacterium]
FTATVFSSSGQTLNGRTIDWDSDSESIALVDNTGMVRGLSPGTTTIRATSGGAIGTSRVTVTPAAEIVLAPNTVSFTAVQNGSTPGDRTVAVSNAGAGTLSGLSVATRYGAGGPTGWLTATLGSTNTPTTLVLSVSQGSIPAGTYSATVDVTAAGITRSVTVQLAVISAGQAIALSAATAAFSGSQGGADPAPQTVSVTNSGGGSLTGLSTAITYTTGQPTGWLAATLSGTTAPATLTLTPTTGALTAGTYSAIVRVSSPVAPNSPQSLNVTFTVAGPQAGIRVNPVNLSFQAFRSSNPPAAQIVDVTNTGGAALTGLAVSITYPAQQTGGWLSAQLNTTTAPATITAAVTSSSLPNGSYSGTLTVTSPVASNSPQTVPVTLQVMEPIPTAPINVVATSISASQINLSWSPGTGVITRYRIERRTGPVGAFVLLIDSVAANVTAYQNTTGLTAGTQYFYRMQSCNTSGCSLRSNETSAFTAPAAPTGLTATPASATQINLSWTAPAGTVISIRVERSTTSGSGFVEIANLTSPATSFQSTGLTTATTYFYRIRACNAGGCSVYTAQVSAITP